VLRCSALSTILSEVPAFRPSFVLPCTVLWEIDTLAVWLVTVIVENIPGDRARRIEQFELISAQSLART
jgi:hypothetical protein